MKPKNLQKIANVISTLPCLAASTSTTEVNESACNFVLISSYTSLISFLLDWKCKGKKLHSLEINVHFLTLQFSIAYLDSLLTPRTHQMSNINLSRNIINSVVA